MKRRPQLENAVQYLRDVVEAEVVSNGTLDAITIVLKDLEDYEKALTFASGCQEKSRLEIIVLRGRLEKGYDEARKNGSSEIKRLRTQVYEENEASQELRAEVARLNQELRNADGVITKLSFALKAAEAQDKVRPEKEEAPRVPRNSALRNVRAILKASITALDELE